MNRLFSGRFASVLFFLKEVKTISSKDDLRINEKIRAREIRLIGPNGDAMGVVNTVDAQRVANDNLMDLVEISPNASPPVCKVMDYGKYRYEQHRRVKDAKKNQKVTILKEIKFRPRIEDHDMETKSKHVREFIEAGDKVKCTIMFRGRELSHPELGRKILTNVAAAMKDIAKLEREPKLEGKNMIMILSPITK